MGEKSKIYMKFCRRAGRLMASEMWALGFEDSNYCPYFTEERTPLLIQFCKDNPSYHIMSKKDGFIHNCFVPGGDSYYLADGDSEFTGSVEINSDLSEEQLLEFFQSKAFTEFRKSQRDRDIPTLDELFPKKVVN
jgi:hypothetical protein